jgi:hypothetical protein
MGDNVFPDEGSPTGYSDLYGNQVDITGQPVNYDSSGQLIDSNGNVIGQVPAADTSNVNNQTTIPGAGNTDAAGNAITDLANAPSWLTSLNKALGGTNLTTSDIAKMAVGAGGIAGAMGASKPTVAPTGYQGGIPSLVANRTMMTAPPATVGGVARRPGSAGINYGGDVTYTPKVQAATGGLMGLAHGGAAGRYLQGDTDGMADKISTSIDGTQDAALSHGEFVVPADVVSHLGNGNSDA